MLEILQFALSGFWTFMGCFILIAAASGGVARIILAIRGRAR